jgi:DNA-directed DNA polymerase III PolC
MAFVHLHVHSVYSLLDSTCRLEELVGAAQEMGLPALALTDRNVLYGAVPFYDLCRQAGLRPILGMEATMEEGYSLVLLAEDEEGYRNLCRLSTILQSFSEPPPRLPWTALRHHSDGLIALTGGNAGWITELVRRGEMARAQRLLGGLLALFGRNNVFLELQIHAPGDVTVVEQLVALAEEAGVRCVATSDVHFLRPQDAPLHLLMTSIDTGTHLTQEHPDKPRWVEDSPPSFYFRSPEEMGQLFARWPRALVNTAYVADRCHLELRTGRPVFPRTPLSDGETAFSRVWKLAFLGAVERYRPLTPAVLDRLYRELRTIEEMGFSPYFLIVADIAGEARRRGIPVLGRGSAASSLVAYTLGITPVDPLAHNLTFERFLHRERMDPPDVDLDFCWRGRDEILDYVYRTYCDSHVAMICTYNTFRLRSAVRETVKAFGLPPREAEAILARCWNGLAPSDDDGADSDEQIWFDPPDPPADRLRETILRAARSLAGLPHHLSIHCGGVVIAPTPITELVPLQRSAKGLLITQYDMHSIERLGLVKMDLLGVRALTAVADTVAAIGRAGSPLTVETIPLDDRETFALLSQGRTVGCFQLESPGVRALQRRYRPRCLDDVMAVISLFRPAPLRGGLKEVFLRRRAGKEPVTYLMDDLDEGMRERVEGILGETYGVILYQEQVLRLLSEVGGLGLGEAEEVRRALPGMRSEAERRALRRRFTEGAVVRGLSAAQASQVWDLLAGFTGYAFCKAHAASYAIVAYRSAYLKAHHPAEHMAAVIENEGGYYTPAAYAEEARRLGLRLLPPHVNDSHPETRGSDGTIRIGLKRVRGLSERTRRRILEESRLAPFASLLDFLSRVQPREDEAKDLIRVGACDGLGGNRAEMIWELYAWLPTLAERTPEGQYVLPIKAERTAPFEIPRLPGYTLEERILLEREILGLAISGHPLSLYGERLSRYRPVGSAMLDAYVGEKVVVAGWPVGARLPRTRTGEWMAFLSLEDLDGPIEVVLFPETFRRCGSVLGLECPYLVQGQVQEQEGEIVVVAEALWAEEG